MIAKVCTSKKIFNLITVCLDSIDDRSGPPLLPDAGQKPKFVQLYIYDTQHEIMHRQKIFGMQTSEIDKELITELLQMIDTHNVISQSFRRVREFYKCHPSEIFYLNLYSLRTVDRRTYSAPSCDEVAALIVGDFDSSYHGRDIIVRSIVGQLQRIYETHAMYWPLQYPLFFPYGEDGYQLSIPYRGEQHGYVPGRRTRVSLREFICFHLQFREHEDGIIHKCRLYEIRKKQTIHRARANSYHLLSDLKEGVFFGLLNVDMYTIEFQKRGLPHAHMLLWLNGKNNLQSIKIVDELICTELRNP
ncbi:hypothetical protein Ahy_A03g013144 [Arachis hypogaea]|uniref:Helitron helicase-like domain-containing protein n=1 Tax=Arachis hypogaea TaxID=3818 RepID=A0A445DUT3_ARAHY|nr:hypothetical protein Ahy_A03g013144 [Arachis hypogaea]